MEKRRAEGEKEAYQTKKEEKHCTKIDENQEKQNNGKGGTNNWSGRGGRTDPEVIRNGQNSRMTSGRLTDRRWTRSRINGELTLVENADKYLGEGKERPKFDPRRPNFLHDCGRN